MHSYYAHIEGKAVTFNKLPTELSHYTDPILKVRSHQRDMSPHPTPMSLPFFSAPGHFMLLLKEKELYLSHISSFEKVTV